jgi:hypothetical protein
MKRVFKVQSLVCHFQLVDCTGVGTILRLGERNYSAFRDWTYT